MNYYQWHFGDYLAHTAHLSVVEDCAYRRLLDAYYLTEKPLPIDVKACARLIRMREHEEVVAAVLSEFFVETPIGWTQARCEEEILKYRDKQAKAKASAERSVESRASKRSTDDQRTPSGRSTDVELTKNQEPITNTPPKGGEARRRAVACPDGVSVSLWTDFLAVRKAKRAPMTDTALDGLRREADKAGLSLADAVAYCVERNWVGFNAGWYADRVGRQPSSGAPPPSKHAAAARAIYGDSSPDSTETIDVEATVRKN